jgi:glycosyltransferase involved in cell wall biosynthesis
MRAQVARANHILVPSEFCRREVIRFLHVAPERVSVTPLAVHAQFRRPPRAPEVRAAALARLGIRRPYLLYVGGYEPHKNVLGLLQAFTAVKSKRPDLSLVLVGSKELPNIVVARVTSLGLSPNRDVRFLLNLTDELTDVYDAAELFVSLSWRETFCLPALEAMTRGLPVVASAWGATAEVVGDCGQLVDPRNPHQAAMAILDLLDLKNLTGLAESARRAVRRFDWAVAAQQTSRIYSRLAGRPVPLQHYEPASPPHPSPLPRSEGKGNRLSA